MDIKANIENLINSNLSNYRIYKDTGVAQSTLSDLKNGKSNIDDMRLSVALKLNEYYLNNKEELQMEKAIKAIENVELGWASEGVKVLGGVEAVAEDYVEVMGHEELDVTAEQLILEKLKEDNRVKEFDEYAGEEDAHVDGYVWVEDVGYWMDLD